MKRILSLLALAVSMLAVPASYAEVTRWRATLSGPAEDIPNNSPGTGVALIIIDDVAMTMSLNIPFIDLVSGVTASHIHCCTTVPLTGAAGVATTVPTFIDFPSGVTSGLYERTLSLADPTTYNPAFLTAHGGTAASASAFLLDGIAANQSYLNIHTEVFPAGEIRGFLVAAPIPEPSSWAMLVAGLAGLAAYRRRRA